MSTLLDLLQAQFHRHLQVVYIIADVIEESLIEIVQIRRLEIHLLFVSDSLKCFLVKAAFPIDVLQSESSEKVLPLVGKLGLN